MINKNIIKSTKCFSFQQKSGLIIILISLVCSNYSELLSQWFREFILQPSWLNHVTNQTTTTMKNKNVITIVIAQYSIILISRQ